MNDSGKKRLKRVLPIIAVVTALILFLPILVQMRDGSVEYKALTYSVIHYRRLYENPPREGYAVEVFGVLVYNDWDG